MRRLLWLGLLVMALAGCASSAPQESEAVPPEAGTVAEVPIHLNTECRNGGTVEAFGFVWLMLELAPLEWRGIESLDGEILFESLERSTFTAGNETVEVSNTIVVGDECVFWP